MANLDTAVVDAPPEVILHSPVHDDNLPYQKESE